MRFLMIAAVMLALSHGMSAPCKADPLSADRVSGAQMRLSQRLLAELEKTPSQNPNIVISPASIAGLMALVDIGADEKMRGAIFDMLGFTSGLGHTPAADLTALRATITAAPKDTKADAAKFDIANIVMFDPASKPYEKAIKELRATGAEVSTAPFSDVENIKRINRWVAEKTRNLIPGILEEQPLPPGLIAVNALYFKGVWPEPFEKERTKSQAFHMIAGNVEVPMMHKFHAYKFKRQGDFAAVEMPYRGGRYSLVLVTNTAHSLAAKDFASVSNWLDGKSFALRDVDLSLPRFTLEGSRELLDPLKNIGLAKGTDSATAFEGLTAMPQQISRIVQKTYLRVDEEGTEAATAIGMVAVASIRRREEPETLTLDRPFIFALRDFQTGLVLMSGYIGKPEAGPSAELGGKNEFAQQPQTTELNVKEQRHGKIQKRNEQNGRNGKSRDLPRPPIDRRSDPRHFFTEPSNIERLPVPPAGYRREFQRMIVSAFLFAEAA